MLMQKLASNVEKEGGSHIRMSLPITGLFWQRIIWERNSRFSYKNPFYLRFHANIFLLKFTCVASRELINFFLPCMYSKNKNTDCLFLHTYFNCYKEWFSLRKATETISPSAWEQLRLNIAGQGNGCDPAGVRPHHLRHGDKLPLRLPPQGPRGRGRGGGLPAPGRTGTGVPGLSQEAVPAGALLPGKYQLVPGSFTKQTPQVRYFQASTSWFPQRAVPIGSLRPGTCFTVSDSLR